MSEIDIERERECDRVTARTMELGLLASTIELSIDEYELAVIDTRELVHLATHELLVDGVDLAVVELVELLGTARL